jgi:hypothetical protein
LAKIAKQTERAKMKVLTTLFCIFVFWSSEALSVGCTYFDEDLALDPEAVGVAQLQLSRRPVIQAMESDDVAKVDIAPSLPGLAPFAARHFCQ